MNRRARVKTLWKREEARTKTRNRHFSILQSGTEAQPDGKEKAKERKKPQTGGRHLATHASPSGGVAHEKAHTTGSEALPICDELQGSATENLRTPPPVAAQNEQAYGRQGTFAFR